MPNINAMSLERNRALVVKETHKSKAEHDKSQEKNSHAKKDIKQHIPQNPYVKVRIIDLTQESSKEKFDKASLYLEVIHGCENGTDTKIQRIPLPTQLSYSGKDIRFDGPAISRIIGKFDSPTTTVLSGSTDKRAGAKLGNNVSVHVPTHAGDFYFELTPDGNVKLNKIPSNLDVDLTTYGKVETAQNLNCRKLKVNAKEFSNHHHVTAKTIEITADNTINNSAVMTADNVHLKTNDVVNGAIHNVAGDIESKVQINLHSANIHNSAKLNAKQGGLKIERNSLFHNAKKGAVIAQEKLEGTIQTLHNEGHISAGHLQLSIIEKLKNFATGKMTATQTIELLAKELINSGMITSERAIKCQADTISQDTITAQMTSKGKLELIAAVLVKNVGVLSAKDLLITSTHGTIQNLEKATLKADVSILNAATVKNAGSALISEKLEVIGKSLVENMGILSAKDLQITSTHGLVHNLEKALMLGDKTTITAATIHNENDIIAKKGMLKILASIILHNDKSAKLLSNDPLDIAARKLINKGLMASATKTYVAVKELLDNQSSGAITAQAPVVELCVNHSDKTNHELLKQILEGRQTYGKELELTAGAGIQNAGKLSGGPVILSSNSKEGFIKILENASVLSQTDIHLISKNIDNSGDLTCINGHVYVAPQPKNCDAKISHEKDNKERLAQQGSLTLIESKTIFKNGKTGKIHAKQGNIDIEMFKFLNLGNMHAGNSLTFRGQKFSHFDGGGISAGTHVDIDAHHIKILNDINTVGDIILRHKGGLWNIADKLHAKGNVHFIWSEARTITQAFTLDGGIHYEVLPTAKQPMHFLVNQLVKGNFSITAPSVNLTIGSDQHYVLLGADHNHLGQKMTIHAKNIYLCQGRVSSMKKMLFKGENLALGRYAGVLQRPSALGCGEDVEFDMTHQVAWHYFEMWAYKGLKIKATHLTNLSSNIIVEGNATLDTPSWHGLLTLSKPGTGQRVDVDDPSAMIAYKILQEQAYAISKPAHFEVRGTLIYSKPMTIFASQVHCGEYHGNFPTNTSFIPYEIWHRQHYYGNPRKNKGWWVHFGDRVVSAPLMAKLSISGVLKSNSPILDISGSVSAGGMELTNVLCGKIGLTTKLALPAPPPFRPCISLSGKDTSTSLFEVTGPGTYASVYRPILPFQFTNAFGPILIVGMDNHLRPNIYNRRCLYHPMQERADYTKALMVELLRAFIDPNLTDPYGSMYALRHHAELLFKSGNTYASMDGNIVKPFIAYKEITFIHISGISEIVLIPILYLPKTLDHALRQDGYGGLFSFKGILIQGANYPDTDLEITGTLDTLGEMRFKKFANITHASNMIEDTVNVTDKLEASSFGGAKVKTKYFQRSIKTYRKGRGNNLKAESIVYEDIPHVELRGTTMTAGAGGVRTQNVGHIEQVALLESRINPEERDITTLLSDVTTTVNQHEATLVPTTINSVGPVRLVSQKALYDNMVINGKLVTGASDEIVAQDLTIAKTSADLAAEKAARDLKHEMDKEDARDKEMDAIAMTIGVAVATAGTGTLAEAALTGTALASNTLAVAAISGAASSAVAAAITKQNMLKSAARGALLGGLGAGLKEALDKLELLNQAELIKKGIEVGANSGAAAIVNKTDFVQELISCGTNELVRGVMPIADDAPPVSQVGNTAVRAITAAAITTAANKGDATAFGNAVAQSLGQSIGHHVGSKVVTICTDRGVANKTSDLKVSKDFSLGSPILFAAAKKSEKDPNPKNYHAPHTLLKKMAGDSADRFLANDPRYTRQGNRRGVKVSSSGSAGSSRIASNIALQNAMARLPLRGLRFVQSPADVLNDGWVSDVRMSQRQSYVIDYDFKNANTQLLPGSGDKILQSIQKTGAWLKIGWNAFLGEESEEVNQFQRYNREIIPGVHNFFNAVEENDYFIDKYTFRYVRKCKKKLLDWYDVSSSNFNQIDVRYRMPIYSTEARNNARKRLELGLACIPGSRTELGVCVAMIPVGGYVNLAAVNMVKPVFKMGSQITSIMKNGAKTTLGNFVAAIPRYTAGEKILWNLKFKDQIGQLFYKNDLNHLFYDMGVKSLNKYNFINQALTLDLAANYQTIGALSLGVLGGKAYHDYLRRNSTDYDAQSIFDNKEKEKLDREFRNTPINPGIGYYNLFREAKVSQKAPPKAERPHAPDRDKKYIPAPKGKWSGFPDAKRRKPMTPYGDGKKRERRELSDGRILEWDYQHGEVEMYDSKGKKHLGSFDHTNGKQLKPGKPGRNIEKYL